MVYKTIADLKQGPRENIHNRQTKHTLKLIIFKLLFCSLSRLSQIFYFSTGKLPKTPTLKWKLACRWFSTWQLWDEKEKLTHDSLPTMPQGNLLLEVLKLGEPSRAFHASSPAGRLSSVTRSQQDQSIPQKCEPSPPNVGTFRAALCDCVYNFSASDGSPAWIVNVSHSSVLHVSHDCGWDVSAPCRAQNSFSANLLNAEQTPGPTTEAALGKATRECEGTWLANSR